MSVFEDTRRFLFGLAYRMLGTRAEAEDAVQEVYLKWLACDQASIVNPKAWLATACTHHCLDVIRSAERSRVNYVGDWLPEPIPLVDEATPEHAAELASSLSLAFVLLIQRLGPKERAAYLLREIFGMDYRDVAGVVGVREEACRKLVSRAALGLTRAGIALAPPTPRQDALLDAFRRAIADGDVAPLSAMLAQDVELAADGGGKVPTLLHTLHGKAAVLAFIGGDLRRYWHGWAWTYCDLNGGRAAALYAADRLAACLSVGWNAAGQACGLYIIRNPDKLPRELQHARA